jgi:hypothetical protein
MNKNFRSRDPLSAVLQGAETGMKTGESISNMIAGGDFKKKLSSALNNKELVPELVPEVVEYDKPVAKTPYGELYKSILGYEPEGKDDTINRLKGQAVRGMPYGKGIGNV